MKEINIKSCPGLAFIGKFDEAAKIAHAQFKSATDRSKKLMFRSEWAEISFQHFDLKCLTHEVYPATEHEMAVAKD